MSDRLPNRTPRHPRGLVASAQPDFGLMSRTIDALSDPDEDAPICYRGDRDARLRNSYVGAH